MPEPPEGQTAGKSDKDRETMLLEVQKRDPDLQLSQQRQEIIGDEPFISAVMDRWPALFSETSNPLPTEYSVEILYFVT